MVYIKLYSSVWYYSIYLFQLANDDIDVPDDFYNEQILFTKPEELMNIFEELQEINLDRIQKS